MSIEKVELKEVTPDSIIGTAVTAPNISLLSFMFPSFLVKKEIFFDYEHDIIYTGKYSGNTLAELSHGTRRFICVRNEMPCKVDLSDRETLISLLYNKWGKVPSLRVYQLLLDMYETDFFIYFKKYWVLGNSKIEDKSDVSMLDLQKEFGKSRHKIFEVYYSLAEIYSDTYIFSSLIQFINRAIDYENSNSSSGLYLTLLKNFHAYVKDPQNQYIDKLKRVYTLDGSTHVKLLYLLSASGKGNL